MEKLMNLLKSRKFWAALVGLMMVVVKAYRPDFPIDSEQITALVVVLASYILGTAVEDAAHVRPIVIRRKSESNKE